MKKNRFFMNVIIGLCGMLLVAASATSAGADTTVPETVQGEVCVGSFCTEGDILLAYLNIPAFDTSLGTLTGVDLDAGLTVYGAITLFGYQGPFDFSVSSTLGLGLITGWDNLTATSSISIPCGSDFCEDDESKQGIIFLPVSGPFSIPLTLHDVVSPLSQDYVFEYKGNATLTYTYTYTPAPAPVPEPAAMLLLGLGLIGLAGARRKFHK